MVPSGILHLIGRTGHAIQSVVTTSTDRVLADFRMLFSNAIEQRMLRLMMVCGKNALYLFYMDVN